MQTNVIMPIVDKKITKFQDRTESIKKQRVRMSDAIRLTCTDELHAYS